MESSPALIPAAPASLVAPYLGGKRYLARRIIERISHIPHTAYVEPFAGMGACSSAARSGPRSRC
jgi:DNA adenine methylase